MTIPPELRHPTPRPAYHPTSFYFRLIILLAATVLLMAICFFGSSRLLKNWRLAAFGKVAAGSIVKVDGDSVSVSYAVDGASYTAVANVLKHNELRRQPPGTAVTVIYLSDAPADGRLELQDENDLVADFNIFFLVLPLLILVMLFAALCTWMLWVGGRQNLKLVRDGAICFCTLTKVENPSKKLRGPYHVGFDLQVPPPGAIPCAATLYLPTGASPPAIGDVIVALKLEEAGPLTAPKPYHSIHDARVR